MSFANNITFSNDIPSFLTTITPIIRILALSLIFSKPMLSNLDLVFFFGNSHVISAGNMTSMNVEPVERTHSVPSLNSADMTTTRILDSSQFVETGSNDITYKGDGCMLCVLVFCYTIPLNY